MNYVLSIDPGCAGTGVALWRGETWEQKCSPVRCANLYGHCGSDWLGNACKIVDQLTEDFFEPYLISRVYIEWPRYMPGATGQAATVRGDIHKLTFLIGEISHAVRSLQDIPLTLVEVNTWKGTLDKDPIKERILRAIPDVVNLNPKTHSWDAIGIGLFMKGFLHESQCRNRSRSKKLVRTNGGRASQTLG